MNKKDYISLVEKLKRTIIRLVPIIAFCTIWLAGCGLPAGSTDPGDKVDGWQTRILAVKIEPDTVAVGDTVRITCIIQDSTDTRFQFFWDFSRGKVLHAKYDSAYRGYTSGHSNYVFWIAPDLKGSFSNDVTVDNGSEAQKPPTQGFGLYVKK